MLLLRLRKMDPIMRIDSAYTSQDNASVGGMSESLHSRSPRNMRRRQIGFPPSPQPGLSPNMWPRQRHDLPRFTFDGASLGPEDGGDSSPESARGQVFADMESISMQDGDWGDLYEDDMYEQYVLLQQTATLTHEGASFYLRLGCLCEYRLASTTVTLYPTKYACTGNWGTLWCQLCHYITGGRYDNHRCHQWRPSWHHNDFRVSVHRYIVLCFRVVLWSLWIHIIPLATFFKVVPPTLKITPVPVK